MVKILEVMDKEELIEEINRLHERYEGILKSASIGIFTTDEKGNVTSSTPLMFDFLESQDEKNNKEINLFNLVSVVNSGLYDLFQEALQTGKSIEAGPIYTTSEGSERFINIKTLPHFDGNGKLTGLTGIIEDVTERAKLEMEIEKLAEITNNSADAIIRLGIFGRIESWNTGAEQILGYNENEIIGHMFEEIVPKEYRTEEEGLWKRIFKEGFVRNFDGHCIHKSGGQIPVNITGTALKDKHNNVVGVSVVMKDLTETKKFEQQIIDYSHQLEHANKLKDLFTDVMRHDLLNPVNVMRLSTELIEEFDFSNMKADDPARIMDAVRLIDNSAKKLEEMVQTAANLAKVESDENIEFGELDLAPLIENAIDVLEDIAGQKNMEIVNNVNGSYMALANPFLEEVFQNLISNAIKYSPADTAISIDIEDEGGAWKIMVKDHGEGVPDGAKKEIFERFKRQEKGAVKGTGLGLAIVKRIVDLHSGRAWVEDNPGGGSIFCISTPKKVG